jgi:DNA-binding transcriptional MerR regulator
VLKIGEFSRLAQVSVKTLRHYDQVGLLKPAAVSPESGYRYYSANQLPRLHRILALKDLGFPLDRIGEAIEEGITLDVLRGLLMLRRAEQESKVQEESERLARLGAQLRLIESEDVMAGDVVLKQLAPQWIASVRDVISAHRAIGALFERLSNSLGSLRSEGLGVALWHDTEYKERELDVEVGVYLNQPVQTGAPLTIRQLPAVTAASTIHRGAFSRIGEAYRALLRWLEFNEYRPAGPTRELFLKITVPVTREDESNVTEIQVPVERA